MQFAFYVSGKATRLKKVLSSEKILRELLPYFRLIVSDSSQDSDLSNISSTLGITYCNFNYDSLDATKGEKNLLLSNFILRNFLLHDIEYCFCFGDHLLCGELLYTYRNRIINFHPSILPMFPGRKSIDKAVDEKAFLMGNTAHFIDGGIDTGAIILQNVLAKPFFIKHGYEGVLDNQIIMLHQIAVWLIENRVVFDEEENSVVIKNADYVLPCFFPKIEI